MGFPSVQTLLMSAGACGAWQEAFWLSEVGVSAPSWPAPGVASPFLSPCPIPSHEISCSWRRPGRFLPGKEGAGDLGGADTPRQSQWLITGVRAQCHVHRFPGDPRDKGDIRDNLNHQEAPDSKGAPPFLPSALAPSLEAGPPGQCSP